MNEIFISRIEYFLCTELYSTSLCHLTLFLLVKMWKNRGYQKIHFMLFSLKTCPDYPDLPDYPNTPVINVMSTTICEFIKIIAFILLRLVFTHLQWYNWILSKICKPKSHRPIRDPHRRKAKWQLVGHFLTRVYYLYVCYLDTRPHTYP